MNFLIVKPSALEKMWCEGLYIYQKRTHHWFAWSWHSYTTAPFVLLHIWRELGISYHILCTFLQQSLTIGF